MQLSRQLNRLTLVKEKNQHRTSQQNKPETQKRKFNRCGLVRPTAGNLFRTRLYNLMREIHAT